MAREIPATEFQQNVGSYFDASAKEPIVITKYNKPARVLIDIDEYERLKKRDTRQTLHVSELTDQEINAITTADYGAVDPELEKLLD